ncbi:MAG: hypothetical protein HYT99_05455, partial [Candidatus Tectomicrobia bacterium]|nr:hypothetical protein [Candidatus Tectomicrobia bacterium]
MPNQVKIDVEVNSNAAEKFKEVSDAVRLAERIAVSAREGYENYAEALDIAKKNAQAFVGPCTQLAQSVQKATQEAAKFPSAMMKAALAAQEMKVGYVEDLGDMAEETLNFSDVLNQAQSYIEAVA